MDQLTNLAVKYGTDKWSNKHHYTPVYHELFKDRRNEIKKVLEIGVAEGAGMFMFRDYFPNATIYGAEIEESRIFREDRIEVIKCDQSKHEDLYKLLEKIGDDVDIIFDDGSHKPSDQIFTCDYLLQVMPKNTIYIIEDVSDPSIVKSIKSLTGCKVEVKKVGRRYDDCLIICKK